MQLKLLFISSFLLLQTFTTTITATTPFTNLLVSTIGAFVTTQPTTTITFTSSSAFEFKSKVTTKMASQETHNENSSPHVDFHPSSPSPPHYSCHYIFLVHGLLGNAKEMSSIQKALQDIIPNIDNTASSTSSTNTGIRNENVRIVTHSVTCNEQRTLDGIEIGGTRVAQEIQEFIKKDFLQHHLNKKNANNKQYDENDNYIGDESKDNSKHDVTISFIGNSLGGLYSRYAISLLPDQLSLSATSESETAMTENKIHFISLHRNLFYTTATPHIGVSSHTYIPLPRMMEKGIASFLNTTGRDLFRSSSSSSSFSKSSNYESENQNSSDGNNKKKKRKKEEEKDDFIYELCTNYERFLLPLSKFRKRIAFVNAFRTDFQVPTATASFLSDDSSYPHTILHPSLDSKSTASTTTTTPPPEFVVAIVQTDHDLELLMETKAKVHSKRSHKSHLHIMSNKLDALGWTKVFIDCRDHIPLSPIPLFKKDPRDQWMKFTSTTDNYDPSSTTTSNNTTNNKVITSKELLSYMDWNHQIHFPLGHTVMVANSKSKFYESLNRRGEPITKFLAMHLLQELFS